MAWAAEVVVERWSAVLATGCGAHGGARAPYDQAVQMWDRGGLCEMVVTVVVRVHLACVLILAAAAVGRWR